jgi:glycosyltransferase involved in cell wall biosynthesis
VSAARAGSGSSPRVSVITTVYNGEPYADRAIPDILAQSFEDFEFILIDDGSQDRTLEILNEVARRDSRVRVLTPGRVGFAAALNYGIARARGEYIARQDFDDRSYPDRLRRQVALLDQQPGVGVVGTYYLLVDEHRGERYVRMPPTDHREILLAMARYIPIAHTMVTFRRQSWVDAGGYPEVNNLVDLRFWLQVAKKGWRFANVPEVLGEHFVHQTSFFHQAFRYAQRQRDLANAQAQIIRELNLPRWMYAYTAGRYLYAYCPTPVKRVLRRTLGGSRERDL